MKKKTPKIGESWAILQKRVMIFPVDFNLSLCVYTFHSTSWFQPFSILLHSTNCIASSKRIFIPLFSLHFHQKLKLYHSNPPSAILHYTGNHGPGKKTACVFFHYRLKSHVITSPSHSHPPLYQASGIIGSVACKSFRVKGEDEELCFFFSMRLPFSSRQLFSLYAVVLYLKVI